MTAETEPLSILDDADPELAAELRGRMPATDSPLSRDRLTALVEDTLWALSMEPSFGRAVGCGLADLAAEASGEGWERYRRLIREAGRRGPTYGRLLAEALVPVIRTQHPRLLDRFMSTVSVLADKGTYTFPRTFEALTRLCAAGEVDAAEAFLDLLTEAFSGEISYNRSQQLTVLLSRGVLSLSPARRPWQIRRLTEACRTDKSLIEPFFEGIEKGLDLLSEPALSSFVAEGIARFREQPNRGRRFFSLESKLGSDACRERQVTVALAQVREGLNRYLRARTRLFLTVRPLGALPQAVSDVPPDATAFFSDCRAIYLPETLRVFSRRSENIGLYKALTRLEAGLHEFGTYAFDLEKALDRIGEAPGGPAPGDPTVSDLERFCRRFDEPSLAMDLFFIFEHGRIRRLTAARYPGLLRAVYPLLQAEFDRRRDARNPALALLFDALVFDRPPDGSPEGAAASRWVDLFFRETEAAAPVETSAVLAGRVFSEAAAFAGFKDADRPYCPFSFPFGQRLRPDLFFRTERQTLQTAEQVKRAVEQDGRYRLYRSDLLRALRDRREPLTRDKLERLVVPTPGGEGAEAEVDLGGIDLDRWLAPPEGVDVAPEDGEQGRVFWYREWDNRMEDYLQRHVRVRERRLDADGGRFYADTLKRRHHLVGRLRSAFEMLRPEGLKILRQWIEGDAFDHRALIDFAVDRKAGRTPSERLYIKRLKQERDIGVLLLVDLSRSTANRVAGSTVSVLDVEKEALVLFCEALGIVGDTFAVAGFSGTGRLGVDYASIKAFDQETDDAVRGRIGVLAPQRNTRMGAAIRHATAKLEALTSRVKLLLVLGDGFPNDADYKQGYAIADTRKAISEARAKGIHVRAITVNLPADPKLDDLFGNVHHNVISDVRELPDRLLRIYSSLTRC